MVVLTSNEELAQGILELGAKAVQVELDDLTGNTLVSVVYETDELHPVYTIADECNAVEKAERLADKLGVPVWMPEFISEDLLYCVFEDRA